MLNSLEGLRQAGRPAHRNADVNTSLERFLSAYSWPVWPVDVLQDLQNLPSAIKRLYASQRVAKGSTALTSHRAAAKPLTMRAAPAAATKEHHGVLLKSGKIACGILPCLNSRPHTKRVIAPPMRETTQGNQQAPDKVADACGHVSGRRNRLQVTGLWSRHSDQQPKFKLSSLLSA